MRGNDNKNLSYLLRGEKNVKKAKNKGAFFMGIPLIVPYKMN